MIKQVKIGNFKSFGKTQEIPLKPITLIFGTNSSGKSSIIHNLVFIEEYFKKKFLDIPQIIKDEEIIDLGGIEQFFNQGSRSGVVTLGGIVDVEMNTTWDKYKDFLDKGNPLHDEVKTYSDEMIDVTIESSLEWRLEINVNDFDKNYVTGLEVFIDKYLMIVESMSQSHEEGEYFTGIPEFNIPSGCTIIKIEQNKENSPVVKLKELLGENPVISYLMSKVFNCFESESIEEYFNKSEIKILESLIYEEGSDVITPAEDMEKILNVLFDEIKSNYYSTYFGPWRKIPARLYGSLNHHSHAWKRLLENEELRSRVNKLLHSLGIQYEVIVEKYHSEINKARTHEFISLRDKTNQSLISANDVGTGISQILPILVAMEDWLTGPIYVEQPELHLHPGLQANWGKALKEASEYNHVIFETHSEHIIKSIQLEVMKANQSAGKDGISNEDVAIIYVSRDENGDSIVKEMELDETGSFIEPWPDDFFELSSDLSFERLKQSFKSMN